MGRSRAPGGTSSRESTTGQNEKGWLQTTLTGPGTVSFRWKVSSEATFDWLEFWIGNQRQDRISGKPD